jgi:hypothetical protein
MVNEKSSFLIVMGESPKMKVLDFLLTFDEFDYSLSDIASNSEVGYTTLMEFWDSFVKSGIVEETRKVGKARMFRLNKKNPSVKLLLRLHWEISKNEIRKVHNVRRISGIQKVKPRSKAKSKAT